MRRLTGLGLSLLLAGTIVANAESLTLIVESAGAGVDQSSGSPVVSIKLRSSSGAAFAKFTADRIGEQIELKIDGKTVTSPVIRDAIYGGQLQISGDYTLPQAKELADKIKSGSVIVEVAGSDK